MRLLRAAKGRRCEAAVVLGLTAGLRVGEALALRWADVDSQSPRIAVRSTTTVTEEGYGVGDAKSRAVEQVIPWTDIGVAALHRQRVLELRLMAGVRWREHELVCHSLKAAHCSPRRIGCGVSTRCARRSAWRA